MQEIYTKDYKGLMKIDYEQGFYRALVSGFSLQRLVGFVASFSGCGFGKLTPYGVIGTLVRTYGFDSHNVNVADRVRLDFRVSGLLHYTTCFVCVVLG